MGSRAIVHVVRLVAVVTVAGVVLGGAAASASSGAAKPQTGGTLNLVFNADPSGMDPILMQGVPNISPAMAAVSIFDELFFTDPATLKLKPKIATGMTTSDKGLIWTMKLRSGVRFSDGTPFDAAAVQYNWQRIADPVNKAFSAQYAQQIATMEVVDPLTLKITLKAADPYFDQQAARHLTSIGSPTAIKANPAAFSTKPVGAGPFLLKEWVRAVSVTYVRNPDYWQKGKPYVDEIVTRQIIDDVARYNTLTTSGAQAALEGATQNVTQLRQDPQKWAVVNTPSNGGGYTFGMNLTKAPFTDLRLRQALSLVLDSAEIVQRASFGDETTIVKTIDEDFSPFYNPKIKLPKSDPVAAQKLIDAVVAEQGGRPVQFTYMILGVQTHQRIGEAMQAIITSKLKNIEMKLETVATSVGSARQASGDFQATLLGVRWTDPAIDLPNTFRSTSALNYARYTNATVDTALNQLTSTTDQKARTQAHETIIQTVLKDVPVIWITRFQSYYTYDKTQLKGWHMFYELRPVIEDVWLAKPKS